MKSKDEIERTKATLKMVRLIMPPFVFILLMVILLSVVGLPFGVSALVSLFVAGADYIALSLMLNRWAGL